MFLLFGVSAEMLFLLLGAAYPEVFLRAFHALISSGDFKRFSARYFSSRSIRARIASSVYPGPIVFPLQNRSCPSSSHLNDMCFPCLTTAPSISIFSRKSSKHRDSRTALSIKSARRSTHGFPIWFLPFRPEVFSMTDRLFSKQSRSLKSLMRCTSSAPWWYFL